MIASDDMVDGYLAGQKSYSVDLPACHMNKSAAFRHGWISGRNDRYPELAERYDVRKRRAEMLLFTAAKSARQHIAIVIDAVRRNPGKTSAELAPLCGLERHEVARRTADAAHAGAIRKGQIRRCNTSGRSVVTWWPA